jgi:hypothetical protein
MSSLEPLKGSIKTLEVAHLCNTVAVYWVTFIAIMSIINLIFLPIPIAVPLNYLVVPYVVARLTIIALARVGVESGRGLRRALYLGAISAKTLECGETRRSALVSALAATAIVLLYMATISKTYALYFGVSALIVVMAGIYAWFVVPYCFALGAVTLTLISIPYAIIELHVTGPSPIHVFATMTATDVLAILGLALVGVRKCLTARR